MKYDKEEMRKMADDFEQYLDIVDKFLIIEGLSKEEYKDAKKKIKKLIKHLRDGKGDKVFNKEKYIEYKMNRDSGY